MSGESAGSRMTMRRHHRRARAQEARTDAGGCRSFLRRYWDILVLLYAPVILLGITLAMGSIEDFWSLLLPLLALQLILWLSSTTVRMAKSENGGPILAFCSPILGWLLWLLVVELIVI